MLSDFKTPTFEFKVPEIGTVSVTPLYSTEKSRLARKFPRMEYVSERLMCEALVLILGNIVESSEGEQRELTKSDIAKINDETMNHFAEGLLNLNPSLIEQVGPSKNAEKKESESFMAYLKRLLVNDFKNQANGRFSNLPLTATDILARDSIVSIAARTLAEIDSHKPYSYLNSSAQSYLELDRLAVEKQSIMAQSLSASSYLRDETATSRILEEVCRQDKMLEAMNPGGFLVANAAIEPTVPKYDYSPPIMHIPLHPGHETNEHIKDLKQEIKELKEVTKEQKDDSKISSAGSSVLNRKMYFIAVTGVLVAIISVMVAVFFGIKGNSDTKKAADVVAAGANIDGLIKSRLDEQKILITLLNKTKSQKDAEVITAKITHLSDEIGKLVASKQKIEKP